MLLSTDEIENGEIVQRTMSLTAIALEHGHGEARVLSKTDDEARCSSRSVEREDVLIGEVHRRLLQTNQHQHHQID